MLVLQLNHHPASASFPVVPPDGPAVLFWSQCFSGSISLPHLSLCFWRSLFPCCSLLILQPSALDSPTLLYFQLSAVSTSKLAPHRFAFLHHIGPGCGYSCCPSAQFAWVACSCHILSILSSVLLPISPLLSLGDTSVDSQRFYWHILSIVLV